MIGGNDVNGTEYEKIFYVPRQYKTSSCLVRPVCKAHGFDIASLDTLQEFNVVNLLCQRHMQNLLHNDSVLIDGLAMQKMSKSDWYWTNSGKKINYEMEWAPNQPNFQKQNQWCLSLDNSNYKFNDIKCYDDNHTFMCQKIQNWCTREGGESTSFKDV